MNKNKKSQMSKKVTKNRVKEIVNSNSNGIQRMFKNNSKNKTNNTKRLPNPKRLNPFRKTTKMPKTPTKGPKANSNIFILKVAQMNNHRIKTPMGSLTCTKLLSIKDQKLK